MLRRQLIVDRQPVASFDDIAGILPNGPLIAVARQLVTHHGASAGRLEREVREARKHQLGMQSAERSLAEKSASPDDSELAALLADASRRRTELSLAEAGRTTARPRMPGPR